MKNYTQSAGFLQKTHPRRSRHHFNPVSCVACNVRARYFRLFTRRRWSRSRGSSSGTCQTPVETVAQVIIIIRVVRTAYRGYLVFARATHCLNMTGFPLARCRRLVRGRPTILYRYTISIFSPPSNHHHISLSPGSPTLPSTPPQTALSPLSARYCLYNTVVVTTETLNGR